MHTDQHEHQQGERADDDGAEAPKLEGAVPEPVPDDITPVSPPPGGPAAEDEDTRPDLPPRPEELWSVDERAFFDAGVALEAAEAEAAVFADEPTSPGPSRWRSRSTALMFGAPVALAAAVWLVGGDRTPAPSHAAAPPAPMVATRQLQPPPPAPVAPTSAPVVAEALVAAAPVGEPAPTETAPIVVAEPRREDVTADSDRPRPRAATASNRRAAKAHAAARATRRPR